eukprot:scaffold69882_cov70-Phaeocystis_antarctica.AAC.2
MTRGVRSAQPPARPRPPICRRAARRAGAARSPRQPQHAQHLRSRRVACGPGATTTQHSGADIRLQTGRV